MLDFLQKPKNLKEQFWALLIEQDWVIAAIWQITDGKVEVLHKSPATRWETDLIEPIDAALSSCTQDLAEDFPDPTKTVFGVPNSWVDGGNIKEEYLTKLKEICKDLSLVPSGFVVLSEAISYLIKNEEGSMFSGIIAGISTESLDLSIFSLGKLVGSTSVLRSVSVDEDITEGLSRLGENQENFPPRVIFFNQNEKELDEIKNNLEGSDWNSIGNSKFIHTPRIEIFDPNKKIIAVALAGGSELGEVSEVVETKVEELPLEEVSNIEKPEGVTAEDLGFVAQSQVNEKSSIIQSLPKVPKLPKINFKIPKFKFNFSLGSKPLILGGSLIFTTLVVGFILWWFLPKASVTIFVSPKKLDENIMLLIGSDLAGETVSDSVSGEKTKQTTGTKTIGEKAKGSVNVQNGTAFPISLPIGTVLISSSDLKFVTMKSASISGALSPSTPGKAPIEVEAGNIGSEYNLGKDEVFKVANYPKSEVDATSVDTFSGGSSRQISAVSADDKSMIMKELTDELISEAKKKFSGKNSQEKFFVDASFGYEVEDESYSNKVGDEASNLKLSITLKVAGVYVLKDELSKISKEVLSDKVPSGFVLKDDQISYTFGISDEENKFNTIISANLLPNVDADLISKKISGKYPNLAESYLKSVPGFVKAEIRLIPTLQGKLGTLPHLPKNISVTVTAER